jgi:hypothetical protein
VKRLRAPRPTGLLGVVSGSPARSGAVRDRHAAIASASRRWDEPRFGYWTIVTTVWSISLAVVITFELAW